MACGLRVRCVGGAVIVYMHTSTASVVKGMLYNSYDKLTRVRTYRRKPSVG